MKRFLSCLAVLISMTISASAQAQTYEDGKAAYKAGHYNEARKILEPLAKTGNAKAIYAIGIMLSKGRGYKKNKNAACDNYEISAKSGYDHAQSNLSLCYLVGEGRPKNIDIAEHWCFKALQQKDSLCAINFFMQTKEDNPDFAQKWGQRAIDAGSIEARSLMNLFDFDYDGPRPSFKDDFCVIILSPLLQKPPGYCG